MAAVIMPATQEAAGVQSEFEASLGNLVRTHRKK